QSFIASGGAGSVGVTAANGCTWNATSNSSFIIISGGSSGAGSGTVNYSVAANDGPARTGTLTIAGLTFTVAQDAASSVCSFSLSQTERSFPINGGSDSVGVLTTNTCNWTAVSNASWITVTSGSSGHGNGAV